MFNKVYLYINICVLKASSCKLDYERKPIKGKETYKRKYKVLLSEYAMQKEIWCKIVYKHTKVCVMEVKYSR